MTLSSIEANKAKTGAGSPWITIVDEPVTFDLADLIGGGTLGFLGENVADPGTYRIIRMITAGVKIRFHGEAELIPVKVFAGGKIQIVKTFEVVAGETTKLLLDFDSKNSLVETPPGSRNFNFKPKLELTVLVEGGVPRGAQDGKSPSSQAVDTAGQFGTIELVVGDTTALGGPTPTPPPPTPTPPPAANVEGGVLLEGRTDHRGVQITFLQGDTVVDRVETRAGGGFVVALPEGAYVAVAEHAGYLPASEQFNVGPSGSVTIFDPEVTLRGGDANNDGVIDRHDLRVISLSMAGPDVRGDINGSGVTDSFDLSLAGKNFGKESPLNPVLHPPGLEGASFITVHGQPTYPYTLMDRNTPTSTDYHGYLIVDADGNIVRHYRTPDTPDRPNAFVGSVGAIAQKPDGNLVYIYRAFGLRENTPDGVEVDGIDDPCGGLGHGAWHHEVLIRPDGKIWTLGSAMQPASAELGLDHGPQVSDTVVEWDPVAGTVTTLFELHDFIPDTDRTISSDAVGGFFWRGCPNENDDSEDWTHSNSIDVGPTGNIIVSMRHVNQIVSIAPDFETLNWRLGGPGSDFSFPDPSDRFYHQHSARELPNGNILLFDNGNRRPIEEGGTYSRALELKLTFKLDGSPKDASNVWEYRGDPDLRALCCSNVTRLPNGNTVVLFGADLATDICCRVHTIVEADSNGNAVWEAQSAQPGQQIQYRAYPLFFIDGD